MTITSNPPYPTRTLDLDAFLATVQGYSTDASKWATEAEDVEVETGLYSAFHWAQKAEEAAATINPSAYIATSLGTAANQMLVSTGSGTWGVLLSTTAGQALLTAANPAAQRTALELGSSATIDVTSNADLSVDPENVALRGDVAAAIGYERIGSPVVVTSAVTSIDFTGLDLTRYSGFMLYVSRIVPVSSAVMKLNLSPVGGAFGDLSFSSTWMGRNSSTFFSNYESGKSTINLGGPVDATNTAGWCGVIHLHNLADASAINMIHCNSAFMDPVNNLALHDSVGRSEAAQVDGIRLLFSSGNIVSGVATLYGMKGA